MIVTRYEYPNVQLHLDGKVYQFRNGECDIPDMEALNLVQIRTHYKLKSTSSGEGEKFTPFNPSNWTDKYKKLFWDGPVGYANGYGNSSMLLIEGLNKLTDVYVVNSKWQGSDPNHVIPVVEEVMKKRTDKIDSFYIRYFPAHVNPQRVADRSIIYTMLESTRIPQKWVDIINNTYERCLVPCEVQRQAFIDSGVRRDVHVIPLGVNPDLLPIVQNKESDGQFMFSTMGGPLTYRKGTDKVVEAFVKAFPAEQYPDVFLYLKTLPMQGLSVLPFDYNGALKKDKRIIMCMDSFSPEDKVNKLFAQSDCFVFPSRGEGFGLPPMEAMCCGIPVIATPWSGIGDFFNDEVGYTVDYKLIDMPIQGYGYPEDLQAPGQQWAEPNLDSLIAQMRYVYENRDKANKKALKAAKHIRDNWTNTHSAEKLVKYLDSKI